MNLQAEMFPGPDGLKPWQRSYDPHAKARTSDPETSHQAARINLPKRGTQRRQILDVIAELGPLTDDEVSSYLPSIRLNSLTTRRSELVALGLVRDTGERRRTSSGARAVVWEITEDGKSAL